MIHHILVGIDGSASSRKAALFAHDLAQQTQSRITLLFVLEPPRVLPLGFLDSEIIAGPQRSPEELEAVRRMLDEVAADLPKAQVDKVVEIGRPADTIVSMAAKLSADLIVMGARGLNPGGKWLLGSVSDRVVQHAGRPVTVVH
ncbi:universal stress protein [Vitiosangium sp. GDMCC 1.1324]|uniref:universal stress protein n=1 Tax=Vitiosangium sp. (strain GDMCC 1.1324) TaxID=2138576 RepID=UPI00130D4BD4|nr:universal stress protein [Vitiosangium sp. GDMCC 1.1324]